MSLDTTHQRDGGVVLEPGVRRRGTTAAAVAAPAPPSHAHPAQRAPRAARRTPPSGTVVCARLVLLLVVGLVFHGFMLFAVFDTYFISPVLHGMPAVTVPGAAGPPPARRAVFIVADGLRADTLYETVAATDTSTVNVRAPFLRSVVRKRGAWGVSHTHVPTETRPGHVALIAGLYEDTSAVFEGWKHNPVAFDSVFNRSRHTWMFGSPDILHMFDELPNTDSFEYGSEEEDFGQEDASRLDAWVFDKVTSLFQNASRTPSLRRALNQPQTIFFLHLLGIDSNGHAHRPQSKEYKDNVRVVDRGVQSMYEMFEREFPDRRTAYVFTSDHGMSNRGSHGDGEPANTRTPVVAWGAGVRGPIKTPREQPVVAMCPGSSPDGWDRDAEVAVTRAWGLDTRARYDMHQADVAPLVAALLGLPFPTNSVGVLPFPYLPEDKYRIRALRANVEQLATHVRFRSAQQRAHSLWFREFPGADRLEALLESVDHLLTQFPDMVKHEVASKLCADAAHLALRGMRYFQTYTWAFIMTCAVLAYGGWMAVQAAFVTLHFTPLRRLRWRRRGWRFHATWLLLTAAACGFLAAEASPWRYLVYATLPILFWALVLAHPPVVAYWLLQLGIAYSKRRGPRSGTLFAPSRRPTAPGVDEAAGDKDPVVPPWSSVPGPMKVLLLSLLWIELNVGGYFFRPCFSIMLLALGAQPWLTAPASRRWSALRVCWSANCVALAVFPLLPVDVGDRTWAVVVGAVAVAATVVVNEALLPVRKGQRAATAAVAVVVTALLAAAWVVHDTTQRLASKQGLPPANQGLAWLLTVAAPLLSRASGRAWRSRFAFVAAALAVPLTLLSVSYEMLFFACYASLLLLWVELESRRTAADADCALDGADGGGTAQFRSDHVRQVLVFVMLLLLSFFGTGNIASISSFEISSTYRYVTTFSPFLMGGLLVFKLLLPFVVCCSALVVMARQLRAPLASHFVVMLAACDLMALNFFFLVRDTGSWQEIGTSISHFCIASGAAAVVPLVFGVAHLLLGSGGAAPAPAASGAATCAAGPQGEQSAPTVPDQAS